MDDETDSLRHRSVRLTPPISPMKAIIMGACILVTAVVVFYVSAFVWVFSNDSAWQCGNEIDGRIVYHECGNPPTEPTPP